MKLFSVIAKIVAALAAIIGAIYVLATYGEKIVAWCKDFMAALPECTCCNDDEVEVEIEIDEPEVVEVVEEAAEEDLVEEAVEAEAEEIAEVLTDADAVVAEDDDFEA
jgi:hypothetical protein